MIPCLSEVLGQACDFVEGGLDTGRSYHHRAKLTVQVKLIGLTELTHCMSSQYCCKD